MITTTTANGAITLKVSGKFNFASFKQFNDAVATPAASYVVDLTQVEYMDSSALGMLLLLKDRVDKDGSKVKILAGAGQPREVLELANFARLFTVV